MNEMHEAAMHNFVGGYLDRYGITETRRVLREAETQWRFTGWRWRTTAPDQPGGKPQRPLKDAA